MKWPGLGLTLAIAIAGACFSLALPIRTEAGWLLPLWGAGALFARLRLGTSVPGWIGGGLGWAASVLGPGDLLVLPMTSLVVTEYVATAVAWRGRSAPWRWWYGIAAGLGCGFLRYDHGLVAALMPATLLAASHACAWLLVDRAGRPIVEGRTLITTGGGYLTFAVVCAMLGLLAPVAACTRNRPRLMTNLLRLGIRIVFGCTPGVRWSGTGQLSALARAPVVIANHESMLDILSSCRLPGECRVMLAKQWVFRTPFLGWAARTSGMRRVSSTTADEFLAPDTTAHRGSLLLFPEGRRSPTGEIQRFRPGAFVLARALDCPVVPVVHVGGRAGIISRSIWIRPTALVSHVLTPLALPAASSNRALAEHCRQLIALERARIVRELLLANRFQTWITLHRIGLAPAKRRGFSAEYARGGWKSVVESVPADATSGVWLLLGAGSGTIPISLRLLVPGLSFIVVDPDRTKLQCACASWAEPGRDIVTTIIPNDLPQLVGCVLMQRFATPDSGPIVTAITSSTVVLAARAETATWATALARRVQTGPGELCLLATQA